MAASDDQIRQQLSKYLSPEELDKVVGWLGEKQGYDPKADAKLRSALIDMGLPEAGADAVVQVRQDRWSTARDQAAQEFAGLTGDAEPAPAFDIGAHGGGEVSAENAQALRDAEQAFVQKQLDASTEQYAPSDFGGFSDADWAAVQREMAGIGQQQQDQQAAAARQSELDKQDQRFGNDLSWLDQAFQQDPTKAITEAQKLGTSADPELVKQQQSLVDEVRGRGLTADKTSRDAQQGALDELMGIYSQGGQTARDKMLRAKARADSENWLRGQREADMQSMAERGVSGSGAEVLSMLGDRQDAASRLSAADLQASADAEQRALDALLSGTQVARGMESSANAYQAGNTAAAGGMLGDMRGSADAYQRANADMIAKIGQTNTDFLRQAQSEMLARRNDWDKYVMGQQTDMAKYLADLDARDNAAGWGFGYQTAGADTGAAGGAQAGFNAGTQGAFTGQTPYVRGAGQAQTGYTGEAQAHAGKAFSGAAQFVGNLFSSMYGGGGGGGNDTTQMSGASTYTPAGEQTGMDKEYR
jgi:hypothetical protein